MKLTNDILISLGFRGEGRDLLNRPAFRFKVPPSSEYGYYHFEIQMILGDYPETNPNSGILSLYDKGTKDAHCHYSEKDNGKKQSKKIDFIQWHEEGQRGGIKYISIPERVFPIAWSVTTLERLNAIYTALTCNPPLEVRKIKDTKVE